MSSKTKILVVKLKEIIYTVLFVVLGIILIVLLFILITGKSHKRTRHPSRSQLIRPVSILPPLSLPPTLSILRLS